MSENEISLKVLEAYTRDVGRGVARIDYDSMDTLSASTGDVIEVKGKRRTVAKCCLFIRQMKEKVLSDSMGWDETTQELQSEIVFL